MQAAGVRGNTTLTLAYPFAVTSGNVLVVPVGWEGGAATTPTLTDTLLTSYASVVTLTGGAENCIIFVGIAGSSGANTVAVVLPASAGYNGIHVSEWLNLSATVDGTATGTTNNNLPLTTAAAGDLLVTIIQNNTSAGVPLGVPGLAYPLTQGGNDSGGIDFLVQPVAGKIQAGMQVQAGSSNGLCAVGLKHK